jgi:hypothetical protein
VYAFFDVSTYCYEVYPEELFHPLFPWFYFGALFDVSGTKFSGSPHLLLSNPDTYFPRFCVPVLWSRRLLRGSEWGRTRRLEYDEWLLPDAQPFCQHEYWNTAAAICHMMGEEADIDPSCLEHSGYATGWSDTYYTSWTDHNTFSENQMYLPDYDASQWQENGGCASPDVIEPEDHLCTGDHLHGGSTLSYPSKEQSEVNSETCYSVLDGEFDALV